MKNLILIAAALLCVINLSAQQVKITGKVTAGRKALQGASVQVKGTSTKTLTNAEGRYSITAEVGSTLVYTYQGFQTEERKVASAGTIDVILLMPPIVALESDQSEELVAQQDLKEVAIMGYGKLGRRETAGAVAYAAPQESQKIAYFHPLAATPSYDAMRYEEYGRFNENRFISVEKDPLSTFALEVDGASYSNVRRILNSGRMPESDAVRVEEFLNYFSYDYPKPAGNLPVGLSYEVGRCPWNANNLLVRIGMKAKDMATDKMPASNFVFLIDVSGSMSGPTRIDLVKASLKLLTNNLRDQDRVAIVTYANSTRQALPSTSGTDKQAIREVLNSLVASGGTAGGAGIQMAYKVARENFIEGGNNRIILCTDGDFNVGVSTVSGLESLIEQERKSSGVFLTVLGYGMGNYKDNRMQALAEKGNGNAAYIDNIQEANKYLVQEFGSSMYTAAKDVKLQVEFNPARVEAYRLVGYESRLLNHEDFNDDTKDAGEVGAGHTVTALYEVVPVGAANAVIDPLKYQPARNENRKVDMSGELMNVKIRYKAPDGDVSRKYEMPVNYSSRQKEQSADYNFAAATAMFAQLLRGSDFKGSATYDDVVALARKGLGDDTNGYRREMVRLAETAKGLSKCE